MQLLTSTGTGNIVVSGVRYPSGANVVFIAGVNYPIYAIPPNGVTGFASWLASNLIVANPLQQTTTAQGAINPNPAACLQVAFNPSSPSSRSPCRRVRAREDRSRRSAAPTSREPSFPYRNPQHGLYLQRLDRHGHRKLHGKLDLPFVTMTNSITEIANYLAPVTVSTYSSPSGDGTVSGGGSYALRLDRDDLRDPRHGIHLLRLDLHRGRVVRVPFGVRDVVVRLCGSDRRIGHCQLRGDACLHVRRRIGLH